jgi:hypothetical protein
MPQVRKVIVSSPSRMPIYGHAGNGIAGNGVPRTPPGKKLVNVNQRRPINSK